MVIASDKCGCSSRVELAGMDGNLSVYHGFHIHASTLTVDLRAGFEEIAAPIRDKRSSVV
jgi:hypothetical protein